MGTPDNIQETTGKPTHATLENDARPWKAQDAAVRDAAARFASLLDDAREENNDEEATPNERRTSILLQDTQWPEAKTPEKTPGAANERPSTCRRGDDERPRDTERSRTEGLSPSSRSVERATAGPIPTSLAEMGAPADAPREVAGSLDALCREIADRVLVSSPQNSSAPGEVLLLIHNSVLPHTEVHISRQAGELCVSLVTGSTESYALLVQHKSLLAGRLAERLETARVEVTMAADRSGDDRRGGSRQRHDAPEHE